MGVLVGMAAGALLAPPLIALLASPLANADTPDVTGGGGDVMTYGPYTLGDFTETLSYNDTTEGYDNFLIYDGDDVDYFYGGSDTYGVLLTDPGVIQVGYEDIGGTPTVVLDMTPADFVSPDVGLTEIGGALAI